MTFTNNDDYMRILENVKEQYVEYLDVSNLYKLPRNYRCSRIRYRPVSLDYPLTTNVIRVHKFDTDELVSTSND